MSALGTFQEAIKTWLLAGDYFAALPIATEEEGEMAQVVIDRLTRGAVAPGAGGKIGLAILILAPAANNREPQRDAIDLNTLVRVSLYYHPELARKASVGIGREPLDVVENIILRLHAKRVGGNPAGPRMAFVDFISEVRKPLVVWHLDFEAPLILHTPNPTP